MGPSREDYFPIKGAEVRRLRRRRGLSMRALSRETGLSINTIRKIEAAHHSEPRHVVSGTVLALSDFFDVHPAELFVED